MNEDFFLYFVILQKLQSTGSQSALECHPDTPAAIEWLLSLLPAGYSGLQQTGHAGARQPAFSPGSPSQPRGSWAWIARMLATYAASLIRDTSRQTWQHERRASLVTASSTGSEGSALADDLSIVILGRVYHRYVPKQCAIVWLGVVSLFNCILSPVPLLPCHLF